MSRTPTDETVDTQYSEVKAARGFLPSLLRRRVPAARGDTKSETIVYEPHPETGNAEPRSGGKPPWRMISFVLIVILPFLASVVYFAYMASDEYTAEARFAVRSIADNGTDNVDSGVLNMQSASQDAYVVTSFIHSTEVLRRIGSKIDYRSMFARPDADFWSRFDASGSIEDFLKYWQNQVTAYIDGPSGIITLKVRTFRPEDSVQLANAIIAESEALINELSQRARNDVIQSVQVDVQRTGKAYGDTLAALNQFQNQSGLLSPEDQAQQTGKLLTGLLSNKLDTETRLFVMKQSAADTSPAYQQLLASQQSLDTQIDTLKAQLTGPENANLARSLLRFSELETNRLVAEQLYEASRRNYDAAVAEALRKALYVSVFVHPSLPQDALYPKRISTPLMLLLGLIVLWSTLSLAWASVQDHRL